MGHLDVFIESLKFKKVEESKNLMTYKMRQQLRQRLCRFTAEEVPCRIEIKADEEWFLLQL